jgi:hypothetical protein
MLANPENEMAGTMPFSSLTDDVAAAMEQWREQQCAFIVETFLMATLLQKRSEYFVSISILFVT